jgi:hypothetical protein
MDGFLFRCLVLAVKQIAKRSDILAFSCDMATKDSNYFVSFALPIRGSCRFPFLNRSRISSENGASVREKFE